MNTDVQLAERAQARLTRHNNWTKGKADISDAFRRWPVFLLIGLTSIQARYRRSRIGQFWITISMMVTVTALGLVWAYLWNLPVADFLPHIAISYVMWGYLTGIIAEGPSTFVGATAYLKQINLPRFTYILSTITRNLIVLGHNLLILPPIFLYFNLPVNWNILLFIPAFLLITVGLTGVATILAILGLRFRDLASLVGSIVQIGFFVTPVIWKADKVPPDKAYLLLLNPFAVFLELVRAPFFGVAPKLEYWVVGFALSALACAVAYPLFVKFRSRITYWI